MPPLPKPTSYSRRTRPQPPPPPSPSSSDPSASYRPSGSEVLGPASDEPLEPRATRKRKGRDDGEVETGRRLVHDRLTTPEGMDEINDARLRNRRRVWKVKKDKEVVQR